MKSIQDYLYDAINTPSDISEHIQLLYDLASKCKHVTEFGFRRGVSTWALLAGTKERLVSYDIHPCYVADHFSVAKEIDKSFSFVIDSSIATKTDIEKTDMLFIDTLHDYAQLYAELSKHHHKINDGGCIAMHDTHTFGSRDESGSGPGLKKAIIDFCTENPVWKVIFHTDTNNGMTVLVRYGG